MFKNKLFAAVIAAIIGCSLAVTAFANPWEDLGYPDDPYGSYETSEPTTEEPPYYPPYSTEEPPYNTYEPPTTEEPPVSSEEPLPPEPEMLLDF